MLFRACKYLSLELESLGLAMREKVLNHWLHPALVDLGREPDTTFLPDRTRLGGSIVRLEFRQKIEASGQTIERSWLF
jgi:hypothetical protein